MNQNILDFLFLEMPCGNLRVVELVYTSEITGDTISNK